MPSRSCRHRSVVRRNLASKSAHCASISRLASSLSRASLRRGRSFCVWRKGMSRNTCCGVGTLASQPLSTHVCTTPTHLASHFPTRASLSGAWRYTCRENWSRVTTKATAWEGDASAQASRSPRSAAARVAPKRFEMASSTLFCISPVLSPAGNHLRL